MTDARGRSSTDSARAVEKADSAHTMAAESPPSPPSAGVLVEAEQRCPLGHELQDSCHDAALCCDVCALTIPADASRLSCEICDYDICRSCVAARHTPGAGSQPVCQTAAGTSSLPDESLPQPVATLSSSSSEPRVGRRLLAWFPSEAGSTFNTFAGTAACLGEAGRFFVVFDAEPEARGLWLDERDDWAWTSDGEGRESAAPLRKIDAPWQPGRVPPAVETVFRMRGDAPAQELLVKWRGWAHVHCQWVPRAALEQSERGNQMRVKNFAQKLQMVHGAGSSVGDGGVSEDDDASEPDSDTPPWPLAYEQVDRLIGMRERPNGLPPLYLTKWRALPYAAATWESPACALRDWRAKIDEFHRREERGAARAANADDGGAREACARPLTPPQLGPSPTFKGGRALRDYQVTGVNWLLYSWHQRRSVILADEMVPLLLAAHALPTRCPRAPSHAAPARGQGRVPPAPCPFGRPRTPPTVLVRAAVCHCRASGRLRRPSRRYTY